MKGLILCLLAVSVSCSQSTEVPDKAVDTIETKNKVSWLDQIRIYRELEEHILYYLHIAIVTHEDRLNSYKRVRSYFLGNGVLKPRTYIYAKDVIQNFKLIKRFVTEWKDIHNNVHGGATEALDKAHGQKLLEYDFPENVELVPYVRNYTQLQVEKKVPVKEIAKGKFPNAKSKITLTSADCYVIASFSTFDPEKAHDHLEWLREAYSRINDGSLVTEYREKMYMDLAHALSQTGNTKEAVDLFKGLVQQRDYNNFHMIDTMTHHRRVLNGIPVQPLVGRDIPMNETSISYPLWAPHGTDNLFRVCAGHHTVDPSLAAKLKCRFTTRNSPIFTLAPLKEEELHLDPKVLFYHNFLVDSEIDKILKVSYGKMADSAVRKALGSQGKSTARASKTSFVDRYEPGLESLHKRSETLVGLNSDTVEDLQVTYYDAGGYYNVHYDTFPENYELRNGNRISTILFYLNDVHTGGETAFHDLYVAAKPERGGALVWDSLRRSGLLLEWAGHGACPVIHGHKWIVTKWFHYGGQMFHRPCTRSEYE